MTTALSRVTDIDMAEEMTSFVRNEVLQEAVQAMLAQANQLPQNVLSLLK